MTLCTLHMRLSAFSWPLFTCQGCAFLDALPSSILPEFHFAHAEHPAGAAFIISLFWTIRGMVIWRRRTKCAHARLCFMNPVLTCMHLFILPCYIHMHAAYLCRAVGCRPCAADRTPCSCLRHALLTPCSACQTCQSLSHFFICSSGRRSGCTVLSRPDSE